ncbi:MAG: hypothetical protein PWP23_2867 [Candidatus Sumerlaeota bacterium]|nr:hypothetical protein [Candidatus Sumerlaeota bacterium]
MGTLATTAWRAACVPRESGKPPTSPNAAKADSGTGRGKRGAPRGVPGKAGMRTGRREHVYGVGRVGIPGNRPARTDKRRCTLALVGHPALVLLLGTAPEKPVDLESLHLQKEGRRSLYTCRKARRARGLEDSDTDSLYRRACKAFELIVRGVHRPARASARAPRQPRRGGLDLRSQASRQRARRKITRGGGRREGYNVMSPGALQSTVGSSQVH